MIEERSWSSVVFDVLNHLFLTLLGLACLLPLIHVFALSLSNRSATLGNLVTLWPVNFTTFNYERIFATTGFKLAFVISLQRVVLGVGLNMLITVLTAYPLALAERLPGRGLYRWLLIFAMLFSAGLIPWYLAIRSLGLLDSLWALVLPSAVQTWHIIIMVNFFRGLPSELAEAATVDGASHWQILFQIYLPLSLPALATLTLFAAVWHWNSWFDGLVLMSNPKRYPLQTYLQTTILGRDFTELIRDPEAFAKLSERSVKAAQLFLAMIPILMIYPFLQRYFVSGLTLGSVKG